MPLPLLGGNGKRTGNGSGRSNLRHKVAKQAHNTSPHQNTGRNAAATGKGGSRSGGSGSGSGGSGSGGGGSGGGGGAK